MKWQKKNLTWRMIDFITRLMHQLIPAPSSAPVKTDQFWTLVVRKCLEIFKGKKKAFKRSSQSSWSKKNMSSIKHSIDTHKSRCLTCVWVQLVKRWFLPQYQWSWIFQPMSGFLPPRPVLSSREEGWWEGVPTPHPPPCSCTTPGWLASPSEWISVREVLFIRV